MTSEGVYGDDGQRIRPRRGGKRPGSGRLPKPGLSPAEVECVKEARARGRGKHGSSWDACARLVSLLRVGNAVDPRTIKDRTVSGWWVRHAFNAAEIKTQGKSKNGSLDDQPGANQPTTGYSGSRIPTEYPPGPPTMEETANHFLQSQKAEGGQPQTNLEVASGGSKA